MYRAYQRAERYRTHWTYELYGRTPFNTSLVAKISYELMIEEQRLIRNAEAKAAKKGVHPDQELRDSGSLAYKWIRNFFGEMKRKWIRIDF